MITQSLGFIRLQKFAHLLGENTDLALPYVTSLSVKERAKNPCGDMVEALWVAVLSKDLSHLTVEDVYVARLDGLRMLEGRTTEEEGTWTPVCIERSALIPGLSAPPIMVTLLHAFLDATAVAITHPVSLLAFTATKHPRVLIDETFSERVGFLRYSKEVDMVTFASEATYLVREKPHLIGLLLGRKGLLTWADTPEECVRKALFLNTQAASFLRKDTARSSLKRAQVAGTQVPSPLGESEKFLVRILPTLRGLLGLTGKGLLHVDYDSASLRLPALEQSRELVQHLTDVFELIWLNPTTPDLDDESIASALRSGALTTSSGGDFGGRSRSTTQRKRSVILLPGIGIISDGESIADAQHTAQLFKHLLAVAQHAEALGGFVPESVGAGADETKSVPEFRARPIDGELSGRVAIVTGGASGIGRSIALRFAAEGACVVVLDIDEAGAESVADEITRIPGVCDTLALRCNVKDEGDVSNAFRQVVLKYGGVDVVVANAGIAISKSIEDTSLEEWQRVQDVNLTGYFLTARESFRVFKAQGGGNLLFISSKAGLAAGSGSTAYGTSKAAELHLARILAEEGGPFHIRVNSICPDAVFQGSSLWRSGWREARARFYEIDPKDVEEYYRRRCALKVSIYPEDIAEAALFLASDRSAKITGAVLNVDGGVGAAYVR